MTATSMTPLPAVADAKNRAARSVLQGLGVDVLVAGLPLLYDAATGWDGSFSAAYWTLVGVSLMKTAAVATVAYVMRLTKTPPGNPAA